MPKHIPYNNGTQAGKVIARFGTPAALARALTEAGYPTHRATVSRWTYDKAAHGGRGCGGYIPARYWPAIMTAARLHGIMFTPEELMP